MFRPNNFGFLDLRNQPQKNSISFLLMAYNFSGLNKRPEHGDLAKILAIGFVLLAIRFIGFAALPGLCLVFFEGGSSTVESFSLPG